MGADTFICGDCQQAFHSIHEFVQHKNEGCSLQKDEKGAGLQEEQPALQVIQISEAGNEPSMEEVPQTSHATQAAQHTQEGAVKLEGILVEDASGSQTVSVLQTDENGLQPGQQVIQAGQHVLQPGQQIVQLSQHILPTGEPVGHIIQSGQHLLQIIQSDTGQLVEVLEHQQETQAPTELHLVPVSQSSETLMDGTPVATDFQVLIKPPQVPPKPARRRGRPKKGEEKNPKKPPPPPKPKEAKPKVPEKDADGKVTCSRCKKSFLRERHFLTHRCLGQGMYVDITKKDALGSDAADSEESEEELEDKDKTVEFNLLQPENDPPSPSRTPRGRGRPRGSKNRPKSDIVEMAMATTINAEITGSKNAVKIVEIIDGQSTIPPAATGDVTTQEANPPEQDLPPLVTHRSQIPDVPIFALEEDRIEFEKNLDNIDLSVVDHMFNVHIIEQDVNEHAPPPANRTSNELSIFSCKECDKVFKTPSHMRLHCLTHTDLKPFTCHKCSYASNSKGNLYTHMRKHTGQYYNCSRCEFRTCNKGHLVEHEGIHSTVRHKCALCKKSYNTTKSMINHIRKYHSHTEQGQNYLAAFQPRVNKNTMLHQCHVCNRKFKKEADRDRHLYVHNIRNIDLFTCDMCDFTATRRLTLERHYSRHRVIYICSECGLRFPSTIRLNQHLSAAHECSDMDERWVELFQQCIDISMFLPEPDNDISTVKAEAGSKETKLSITRPVYDTEGEDDLDKVALTVHLESAEPQAEPGQEYINKENMSEQDQSLLVSMEDSSQDLEDPTAVDSSTLQLVNSGVDGSDPMEDVESQSDPIANLNEGDVQIDQSNQIDTSDNAGATAEESADNPVVLAMDDSMDALEDYDILQQLNYSTMNMETFHKLRQTYGNEECEYCGRLFYSLVDYEPHVRTHTGAKPYTCEQCSFRSNTKDNLKRHVEKEHDKVTYVCNACEFVASSRTQLWHHQQKHKQPSQLTCPKCQAKVKSAKFLRIHLGIKHPDLSSDEIKQIVTRQKPQGKLGRRSYKCPYCPKTFLRASSDLQKHIWIHEGIKPYKCPHCPHACRSKNNLNAHLLKHSADKPFSCIFCGKAYKSKTALRWHERTHKDGKIFKCHVCHYEAIQKSHLKRHMETHNVVKRFVCHHCDYSCNTLGFMKIHYTRSHHGISYNYDPAVTKQSTGDTRVYRCLSCDYLFGNLSDMKRHLKVRHHLQVEEIRMLEDIHGNQTAQIVTSEIEPQGQMELQVVEVANAAATPDERDATTALQTLQFSAAPSGDRPENLTSAVNVLQQIIDMSQENQDPLVDPQQITVTSEDGQQVAVGQNTIIVQNQDGEEIVLATDSDAQTNQQYVIQYINPDGSTAEVGHPASQSNLISVTPVSSSVLSSLTSGGGIISDTSAAYQIVDGSSGGQLMNQSSDIEVTSGELISEPASSLLMSVEEEVSAQPMIELSEEQFVDITGNILQESQVEMVDADETSDVELLSKEEGDGTIILDSEHMDVT